MVIFKGLLGQLGVRVSTGKPLSQGEPLGTLSPSLRLLSVASFCLSLLSVGCSGSEELPGLRLNLNAGSVGGPLACQDGSERACSVTLSQSNGALQCFHGVQTCSQSKWGACTDGEVRGFIDPRSPQSRSFFEPLSLNPAESCYSNPACEGIGAWDAISLPGPVYSTGDVVVHENRLFQCDDAALCNADPGESRPVGGAVVSWTMLESCAGVNPCDPNCLYFPEDPDDITAPGGTAPGPMTTPDYDPVGEIQACSHSLCNEGAALPAAGCDDKGCVEMLCDPGYKSGAYTKCCSTGWDSDCVNEMYRECASIQPPLDLCDFGLFSEGALSLSGGSLTDVTVGAASVSMGSAGAVSQSGTKGTTIYSGGDVSLNFGSTQATTTTYVGSLSEQNGANAGTTFPVASLDLPSSIPERTVNCLSSSGNVNLNGADASVLPNDMQRYTATGGTITLNGPGDYGGMTFNGTTNVIFTEGGTYNFPDLNVGGNGSRFYFPEGERVDVETCGQIQFQNNAKVYRYSKVDSCAGIDPWLGSAGTYVSGDLVTHGGNRYECSADAYSAYCDDNAYEPGTFNGNLPWKNETPCAVTQTLTTSPPAVEDLTWYTSSTNSQAIFIGPSTHTAGVMIAPNGGFHNNGSNNARLFGAAWAASFSGNGQPFHVDSSTFTVETCEAMLLLPSDNTLDCAIPNVTQGQPAALVEPCQSGEDCQMNHSCIAPETDDLGGTCAHSKCVSGVAMGASCDDRCVERICDIDATCCTDAWTQDCVDKVDTVCDAKCSQALCSEDPCSVNTGGIAASCDTCVASVIASRPTCESTWDSVCVSLVHSLCGSSLPDSAPSGGSICDYAVYGTRLWSQGSSSQKNQISGGWVGQPSSASMNVQYTIIDGSLSTSASLNADYSTITGSVVSGAASYSGASAVIGGGFINTPPPPASFPVRPALSCSAGDPAPSSGAISPGNYGNVQVPDGATLTLSGGTYNFNTLSIGDADGDSEGARLAIAAGATVSIQVCGALTFETYSAVSGLAKSEAMNVDFYAEGEVRAEGHNQLTGLFLSAGASEPSGRIYFGQYTELSGLMIGQAAADLKQFSTVDASGMGSGCKARGLDGSVDDSVTPGRLCAYSIYGINGVNITQDVDIIGGDLGSGSYINIGVTGTDVQGSIYAQGNVNFSNSVRVQGEVEATGNISGGTPEVYWNTTSNSANTPDPPIPALSIACAGTLPTSSPPKSGTPKTHTPVAGTRYKEMNGWGDHVFDLSAGGDFYFTRFNMNKNNTLLLPNDINTQVNVYVCDYDTGTSASNSSGQIRFSQGAKMQRQDGTPANLDDAKRLRFMTNSDLGIGNSERAVFMHADAGDIFGTIYAPNGPAVLAGSGTFYGTLWAERIFTSDSVNVDSTGLTGAECVASGYDSGSICPLSLTPIAAVDTAECIENSIGYEDTDCAGYDLALGVPCGDQVQVCNHGTMDFSGNVKVAYYPHSALQMAKESPTVTETGSCTQNLSIDKGNCAYLTCASLESEPATALAPYALMVDPDDSLNECDDRRLDNWSVYDGRVCSSSGGGTPMTVSYTYEAVCPDNKLPLWGALSWDVSTPGDSYIAFSLRYADTVADLSGPFLEVGRATSTPDNQSCSPFEARADCPIDITDQLALPKNSPAPALELEIHLEPTGESPTLRAWDVTYTCVTDQ